MQKWQFQEAKAKLSAVIKNAVNDGPQEIMLRGKGEVVILSRKQYIDLTAPKSNFIKFLQNSPLHGIDIDLERNKTPCRDIEL